MLIVPCEYNKTSYSCIPDCIPRIKRPCFYLAKLASYVSVDGEIASRILDLAGIVVNKNTTAGGDESAAHPSAIRFGTTWVTRLGYGAAEMKAIAECTATLLRSIRPFCSTT